MSLSLINRLSSQTSLNCSFRPGAETWPRPQKAGVQKICLRYIELAFAAGPRLQFGRRAETAWARHALASLWGRQAVRNSSIHVEPPREKAWALALLYPGLARQAGSWPTLGKPPNAVVEMD
jgi:hypothetical protein